MKNKVLILFLVLFCIGSLFSEKDQDAYQEKDYQKCCGILMDGDIEVRLDDGSRCDIVTKEYAIEVDFAYKWAEAIGQSLYYAAMLNKKPGIVLIVTKKSNLRFYDRLMIVNEKYNLGIEIWLIRVYDK